MGDLFKLDNPFFVGVEKVLDSVWLNLLWLLCCAPTIASFYVAFRERNIILYWLICWATLALAGPALTAFYYTVNKVIRHGRGYIWKEYWRAFRGNGKRAAAAGLLLGAVGGFFGVTCMMMYYFSEGGLKFALYLLVVVAVILWAQYLFPYLARFETGILRMYLNAAYIAVTNYLWTILLFVILLLAAVLIWVTPLLAFVVPVIYMLLQNLILERIFKKYLSEEELAAMAEQNREYGGD